MSEPKSIGGTEEKPPTKVCKTCGIKKELTQFSPSKLGALGRKPKCKPCMVIENRAYRAANLERIRIQNTRSADKNRDKIRAYHRRAGQLPSCKAKNSKRLKDWRIRHPERVAAQEQARRALRRGELVRPSTCAHCGNTRKLEMSHTDYSKPIDIEWLCHKCHRLKDARLRREGKM